MEGFFIAINRSIIILYSHNGTLMFAN